MAAMMSPSHRKTGCIGLPPENGSIDNRSPQWGVPVASYLQPSLDNLINDPGDVGLPLRYPGPNFELLRPNARKDQVLLFIDAIELDARNSVNAPAFRRDLEGAFARGCVRSRLRT
jgi:hypothetical protein